MSVGDGGLMAARKALLNQWIAPSLSPALLRGVL